MDKSNKVTGATNTMPQTNTISQAKTISQTNIFGNSNVIGNGNHVKIGVDPQVVENLTHQLAEAMAENKRLLGILEKLTKKQ